MPSSRRQSGRRDRMASTEPFPPSTEAGRLRLPRDEYRGTDLRNADLRQADLRGKRFIDVNLSGANLSGAKLHGAKFVRTNLEGANLRAAILTEATLKHCNLDGANISYARCDKMICSHTMFRGIYGSRANFQGAHFTEVDFSPLGGSTDRGETSILVEANFTGATIENSTFRSAYLSKSKFRNASITDTNFKFSFFKQAVMTNLIAENSRFDDADFENANLQGSKLHNTCVFKYAVFSGANLSNVKASNNVFFHEAKFINTTIVRSNFEDCAFRNADCKGANFEHSYFMNSLFYNTCCNGANFYKAVLNGIFAHYATFAAANMENAVFQRSDLEFATFSTTKSILGQEDADVIDFGERAPANLKNAAFIDCTMEYTLFMGTNYIEAKRMPEKDGTNWIGTEEEFQSYRDQNSHNQRVALEVHRASANLHDEVKAEYLSRMLLLAVLGADGVPEKIDMIPAFDFFKTSRFRPSPESSEIFYLKNDDTLSEGKLSLLDSLLTIVRNKLDGDPNGLLDDPILKPNLELMFKTVRDAADLLEIPLSIVKLLFASIHYIKRIHKDDKSKARLFAETYLRQLVNESSCAYVGTRPEDRMSCPKGILERIIKTIADANQIVSSTLNFHDQRIENLNRLIHDVGLLGKEELEKLASTCYEKMPDDGATVEMLKTCMEEEVWTHRPDLSEPGQPVEKNREDLKKEIHAYMNKAYGADHTIALFGGGGNSHRRRRRSTKKNRKTYRRRRSSSRSFRQNTRRRTTS
jgi:uncharacterized protein YjbI with pentapeptide repeats